MSKEEEYLSNIFFKVCLKKKNHHHRYTYILMSPKKSALWSQCLLGYYLVYLEILLTNLGFNIQKKEALSVLVIKDKLRLMIPAGFFILYYTAYLKLQT